MQRPSGARPRSFEKTMLLSGVSIRLTPPASARSDSPERRLAHARWIATSEEEHAVSIWRFGPSRPSTYERRPVAMLSALPVPV